MPKDRFAAHNARDRVMKPSDKEWEGGIIRTFLIQYEHSGLVCTECRMELREGHTAAVYLNREGLRSYRHLMPDECQSLARIRESRRLAREERQLQLNQEMYLTMPSTNDPSLFSGFKHKDGLFVMKLADACGWRLTIQTNGMGVAVGEDGTAMKVPSDTGLRSEVFRSWVSKIWTHTDREARPAPVDLLRLMGDCKVEPSQRKMLWKVFGVQAPTEPKVPEPSPEPIPPRNEQPKIISEEPLLVKPGSFQEHRSESVIERRWSNGTVDYQCSRCDRVAPSPPAITAHFKVHINDDRRAAVEKVSVLEAAALQREAEASVALDGDTQSIPVVPPAPDTAMTDDEMAIIDLILSVMRRASARAAQTNSRVIELEDRLRIVTARAEKAEGDLDALRDLLGVNR